MTAFEMDQARKHLQSFEFQDLFIETLFWDRPARASADTLITREMTFRRRQIAQLSGAVVFELIAEDGEIPPANVRDAVQKQISQQYHENLLIFLDESRKQSVWYWVKREGNKRYPRSHHYMSGQSGDLLLSKISAMFVDMGELDADGNISIVEVARRMREGLDVERVTKKFYDAFRLAHETFLESISGIDYERDRQWYASVVLNRLMFIYFLQRKGFIDRGDREYLQNKLTQSQEQGPNLYYSRFLKALFFEGFARPPEQRSAETRQLLGEVRYLNGGLFLRHQIEIRYPDIAIPDSAFERLFDVFQRYSWNLNDTPGGEDDEINPDVLGYIFEKYINQKAFGAYYTRPEITEYLCEQTVHKLVLDRLAELTQPLPGRAALPQYDSVGDLLLKLDATQSRLLLNDVLPNLSLLDPACGSGAFLVAAMKTMLELYRAVLGRIPVLKDSGLRDYLKRIDRDHPSRDYYVKKQIITYNLYGVDIMEEAVEIARLRLFLALVSSAESVDDLEPLPNIDFNILAGNSLIGLLRVEEDAYQAFHQRSLFDAPARPYRDVVSEKTAMVKQYRDAADRDDLKGNVDAIQGLRDRIEQHRHANIPVLNKMLLAEFRQLGIKYEQATWDTARNKAGKPNKRELTLADIEALQPFHWGYEFDSVMNERGGFDAIVTNPPWEIWKPQAKEFFAEYADVVTKNKMRIEAFQKEQQQLLRNAEIRSAWLAYLSRFPHQSAYFRTAAQYAHQTAVVNGRKTGSDINLYKLFTEQCYNLLHDGGLCGTVIPSGIYTDLGATGLRQMLFQQARIEGIFGFENRKGIFEAVDSRFKFVVLTFRKGGLTKSFPAAFMRRDVAELQGFPANGLEIRVKLVERLSPDTLSLMEFDTPLDIQIAEKMLRFPLLGEEVEGAWQLSFTREFDMTNHSYLFRTEPCETCLPLYEGKMIHQFDHLFAEPRYWVKEREGRAAVLGKRREDYGQMLDYQTFRLGFRDIARNTDSRTLICTIIAPAFHGNKLPTVRILDDTGDRMIENATQTFVCGVWNSFVMDWLVRQKVSTTLNYFYLYQLAMPRSTDKDAIFLPIVRRTAQLICTTPDFDALAAEIGLGSHENGVTDPVERAQLRAELDGIVAHLYGLSEEEFAHILSTFPLVEDAVKEATLQEYRRLAPDPEIMPLILAGESASVEFKTAAAYNPHTGKHDNAMRNQISEAVAAFMNASGGALLIGVADDGTIVGINQEYKAVNPSKANWDGYALFLADVLDKSLSLAAAARFYSISRHSVNGLDIARIQVQPASEPVYVNNKLFVRQGARSIEQQGPNLISYVQSHWTNKDS